MRKLTESTVCVLHSQSEIAYRVT